MKLLLLLLLQLGCRGTSSSSHCEPTSVNPLGGECTHANEVFAGCREAYICGSEGEQGCYMVGKVQDFPADLLESPRVFQSFPMS